MGKISSSPCVGCEKEGTCNLSGGCEIWMEWFRVVWGGAQREAKMKFCEDCGAPIYNAGKMRFCPECRARRKREQQNNAIRAFRAPEAHRHVDPDMGSDEFNARQKKAGLTYGGRPIVSQHVGWPKFLQGAVKRWRKNA